jgi:hypothetical protein
MKPMRQEEFHSYQLLIHVQCWVIFIPFTKVAPLIGGFLSRPWLTISALDIPFFRLFPYCIPNIIVALIASFVVIIGFFFLDESLVFKTMDKTDYGLLPQDEKESEELEKEISPEEESRWIKIKNYILPILSKSAIASVIMKSLITFSQIIWTETFPIWMWTPITHQGIGLSPKDIGIIQTIGGILLLVSQLLIIYRLIERFGKKFSFFIAAILIIPSFYIMPEITRLTTIKSNVVMIWVFIILVMSWRSFWNSMLFQTVNLLINNAVPKENLGALNGLVESCVSISRAIGPIIGAPLFAFSINNQSYPLDVHLVFYLNSIFISMVIPLTLIL